MRPYLQCDQIWRNFATLQKLTCIWQILDSLFLIWQNAEHTLANLWHYWASFHWCKWPNIEKQSNHLVTLLTLQKVSRQFILFALITLGIIFQSSRWLLQRAQDKWPLFACGIEKKREGEFYMEKDGAGVHNHHHPTTRCILLKDKWVGLSSKQRI